MIPLKFKDESKLVFYDDFIETFKSKIKKIKENGQYVHEKSIVYLKKETIDFLEYLLIDENLSDLANCPADKLIDKVNEIRKNHDDRLNKNRDFHSQVKKIFVDAYTQFFPRAKFIKALDIKVCPYCNRSYIYCIDKEDGTTCIKGQLDHFYSKEDYPFLAISKFNLVPSCSDCNGPGGKYRINAAGGKSKKNNQKRPLVNPYLISNTDGLKFRIEIEKGLANFKDIENSIKIIVEEKNDSGLLENINTFHLKEIYNSHCDVAAEIYLKSKMMSKKYRSFIKRKLRNLNLSLTDRELNLIILNIETDSQYFRNKSLSKFKADLAKDLLLF
ncbi:hypothetical protein [Prevotella pallens]|jgi:hypothetical protein|nr:hypothetical protein [Prevotella pallens]